MAAPLRLQATSASPGVASGPAYIAEQPAAAALSQSAVSGHAELAAAIETATEELQNLATGTDAEGGDIIDFQLEVLRDPTIAEMAGVRIDAGENVVFAWVGTLDGYIRELESAEEDQLRARAVDILDIKNRVLAALTGTPVKDFPAGSIYVGKDMEPSRFLAHDWSAGGGIALYAGSAAGHVALLARSRSVPMVIGAGRFVTAGGQHIRVDGDAGVIVLQKGKEGAAPIRPELPVSSTVPTDNGMLQTSDGAQILLSINLNALEEIDGIAPTTAAGIGLMRSEFAVASLADAANEEKQLAIYRRVLDWADGRSVTIRMLDVGGDKPLPGLAASPALRGIRLLLARPEITRVQVRALLRAAIFGHLRVMLPMVTFPSEVDDMRQIFREEAAELARRGVPHRLPSIGMMVEVPAAAFMLEQFEGADFFSFGTNDLAQYLAASTREDADFAAHREKTAPAVLRLLAYAVKLAGSKPLSICGDMAGDPRWTAELLAAGIRHFSMAPAQLPAIRSAIVGLNAGGTKAAGE
ncbi:MULTISPECIES: putative PEP-binding protein [Rhizobium]|nr:MULTISPECIES: putative PEP-binding protein [Rhizobium]MCA0807091.1 phosphoenolpyruvate--protein phosphotransferase [Rhizobium sp. T1473]MCS0460186.1 phosphoenolpyruvate--protein phosphotransferase [Rhizobium favelukesii]UFS85481.1 phosphoenolpyruvate--protein phosphotransferase [Rhizobium sp. T136]